MLEELNIRDYAIIDRLNIRFKKGLNLLSGETGAGKSILIGALGFLLGEKSDTGAIRTGAEEAIVSGTFIVDKNDEALAWLEAQGIEPEDGMLILRRSIKRNGRATAYIQGNPVTRQNLTELASLLVELHGQRDSYLLLKKERQRMVLDRFAGIIDAVDRYSQLYNDLVTRRRSLEAMAGSEADRAREAELASFAIKEIEEAQLKPGEDDQLREEEQRLAQHEKLFSSVETARMLLSDADGVLGKLRKARAALEQAVGIDQRLGSSSSLVDDAYYNLEDVSDNIRSYAGSLSFDPQRLEEIETRLAFIQRLKRKYGDSINEVLEYLASRKSRLKEIENWDEDRSGLEKAVLELENRVYSAAEKLSLARRAAAGKLETEIARILASLGLASSRFVIRMDQKAAQNGKAVIGPFGFDEPGFYVSFNKGENLRPLAMVASGGELSRLMLAVKSVLSGMDDIPSMIFDEVDTGIGGEVAIAVGAHLAALAGSRQVLCITHLASIAARADTHYKVEKKSEGERTITTVSCLNRDSVVKELARMLSGDPQGSASLAHAEDLLQKLGSGRGS